MELPGLSLNEIYLMIGLLELIKKLKFFNKNILSCFKLGG